MRKVAFTGSTPVGERVAAQAAKGSKRVTLELGGSDPMIICDDADLAAAASAASMGRFYNCGQACLAIKRVYVFESVADEVIEAIAAKAGRLRVGLGSDPEGCQMGPLHTEGQRDELERQIAETLAGGGELLDRRASRPTTRSWRTAGSTSRPSSSTRRKDSPMAHARRSSVRRCRSGASRTWTRRSSWPTTRRSGSGPPSGRATSTAPSARRAELDCGYTWINSRTKVYDELPFGGLKASGYGKEHGSEAFDFYTDKKSVVVKRG